MSARAARGCDQFAISNFSIKRNFTFGRKEIASKKFAKKDLHVQ